MATKFLTAVDAVQTASDDDLVVINQGDAVRQIAKRDLLRGIGGVQTDASGETIVLSDSADRCIEGLTMFGKSEQVTTTGKNLFDPSELNDTDNEYYTFLSDGGIKQTATDNRAYAKIKGFELPAGTYTLSCDGFAGTVQGYNLSNSVELFRTTTLPRTITLSEATTVGIKFFGASSYPITLYPQIELGTTVTSYEPYTGGAPSPSPDYPQEIESVDNADVRITGKNLYKMPFDIRADRWTKNGTYNGMTVYTCTTIWNGLGTKLYVEKGTYTFSAWVKTSASTNYIFISTSEALPSATISANTKNIGNPTDFERVSLTFNVTEAGYIAPRLESSSKGEMSVCGYMLEYGTEVTDYEPYKPQELTIPHTLRGISVTSGGNYTDSNGQQWIADELHVFADGSGEIVRNVGSVTVDIDSSTLKFEVHPKEFYYRTYVPVRLAAADLTSGIYAMCDKFKLLKKGGTASLVDTGFTISGGNSFFVIEGCTTKDEYLEALGDTITVTGLLAEPTTETLTADEVSAILALQTYKPTTIITNDASTYQTVSYVADPKTFIENKITEIVTALINQ